MKFFIIPVLLAGGLSTIAQLSEAQSFLPFDAATTAPDDVDYEAGTAALDTRHFEDAIRRFNAVIQRKSAKADAAYYWKAYAQGRSGRPAEALSTLAALRRLYPQSRWLDDGRALELEIHTKEGRPVSPASESNDELKLMAINSLMSSDPGRALPVLKNLLSSNQPVALKDRALFVLSQSNTPEAQQLLVGIARAKAYPELQSAAVRYLSMMGGAEGQKQLAEIYESSNDLNLKREIIHGYLLSNSKAQLLQAARSEKNADLQNEAIRTLAQSGGKDELWALYKANGSLDVHKEIVQSMLLNGDSAHLLEIAQSDRDPKVRKLAIQTLALTGWGKDNDALASMYRSESDESIKRSIVEGMFLQQNAKGLIALARQEKNPELKRHIVQQLSLIQSKDTTDYMLELLK